MSATLGMRNLQMKTFGHKVNVPNNPFAILMYYLNCVNVVIQYEENTLTDYNNYHLLNTDQLAIVYALAKLLNPQLLIKANIFINDPRLVIGNADNQFYKITDETIGVHVNQEIMIGGKYIKVLNVMACNDRWLSTCYYTPFREIDAILRNNDRVETEAPINDTKISNNYIVTNHSFGANSIATTCIYCRKPIMTKTETKFSFLACFCFLLTGMLYCCFQFCSGRNICCCNIYHRCPRCGRILGAYKSC